MQFLKCTHVDAVTRVPINLAAAVNGPDMPAVDGLAFVFANESQYPTPMPVFFCTAPAGVDVDVPGVLAVLTQAEFAAAQAAELAARKVRLQERATAQRWAAETGGVDFAGARIATAVEDQNRITSVIANANLAGVQTVDFKAATGWLTLTIAQIQAVAAAIAMHVQACFTAERAHHEAIELLDSFAAVAAYDVSTGWPGQAPEPVPEE